MYAFQQQRKGCSYFDLFISPELYTNEVCVWNDRYHRFAGKPHRNRCYLPLYESREESHIYLHHQPEFDRSCCCCSYPSGCFHRQPFMPADDGVLAQIYCRVWLTQTLQWGFIRSSTVNLMFLPIERYIAVVHLIRYKTPFTRNKVFASLDDVLVKPTPLYGSTYCQHLRHHDKTLDRTPLLLRPNSAHTSTSFPASETHGLYCLLSQAELSPNADVLGSAHNDLCHQGKSVTQTLSMLRHLLLCNLFLAPPIAPAGLPPERNRLMFTVFNHSCHSRVRPMLLQSVHLHCKIRRVPGRTPQIRTLPE